MKVLGSVRAYIGLIELSRGLGFIRLLGFVAGSRLVKKHAAFKALGL